MFIPFEPYDFCLGLLKIPLIKTFNKTMPKLKLSSLAGLHTSSQLLSDII